MLELKGINKTFNPGTINEKKAIVNLDLSIKEGDFITVIGSNGAGKSTVLNLISGVIPIDSGKLILEDKDILLNSINVLVKDSSPIKNICDFYINKISENQIIEN